MIQSLYLVYKACKNGRLNGSLSLVCKRPDSSKPERRMRGRKREEKAINGQGSRMVQRETMYGCGTSERDFPFQRGRGKPCNLPPKPTPGHGQRMCGLAKTMELVPHSRPPLSDCGDWALSTIMPFLCTWRGQTPPRQAPAL